MDSFVDDLLIEATELCERLSKLVSSTEAFIKTIRKTSHWKNPNLYKTTICDHWRSKRKCKSIILKSTVPSSHHTAYCSASKSHRPARICQRYGAKCWYAHGSQELRSNGNQLSEAFNCLSLAPSSQGSQQNGLSNGVNFQQPPFELLESGYASNAVISGQDQLRPSLQQRSGLDSHHALPGAASQYQPSTQPPSYFNSSLWMGDPIWFPDTVQDGLNSVSPPSVVQPAQQHEVKSFGQFYHLFHDQPFQNPLQKFVNSSKP